ncbi:MAG TPA: Crp/Fnr family transcriptional regulator [Burkholderiaceae bacterium]|nr:Crp/Fnr family transcriptional regulator [Burkholderiaceae bacterium]
MADDADAALLRRNIGAVRFCNAWPPEALAALRPGTEVIRLSRGQTLVARNQAMNGLYGVIAGALEVRLGRLSSRSQVRMLARSGEAFGFIGVFGGYSSPHTYIAKEPSIVLRFSKAGLLKGLHRYPELWLGVVREMASHQVITLAAAEADNLAGVRVRMIRTLLSLAESRGRRAADEVELGITQDSLGAMLLVSRQSVNTELRWLKERGVLTTGYRHIRLTSIRKLSALLAEYLAP